MSLRKAKDVNFTFQDASGKIRVVAIQLQHFRGDDGKDRVSVIATSDGVPVEATARISPATHSKVKTKSRL